MLDPKVDSVQKNLLTLTINLKSARTEFRNEVSTYLLLIYLIPISIYYIDLVC